ncbi:MAG: T9SS type A sorting domain-containing protein [Bacteroidales bacterium]|nr:T9SS type A sorting domain-containing protein [Bacteroidales bacterium]
MKRKFLSLLLIMVFFAFTANAQDFCMEKTTTGKTSEVCTWKGGNDLYRGINGVKAEFLNESFDTEIPATWLVTNTGTHTISWEWNDGTNGMGSGGNAFINSDGAGGGVTVAGILTSPTVDCSGATDLYLGYLVNHQDYAGDGVLNIEVFDGTDWQLVNTITDDYGVFGGIGIYDELNVTAYANANFAVRFDWTDEGAWAWHCIIDEVVVYSPAANDLAVINITPDFVFAGDTYNPTVTVRNAGTYTQTTYDVTLYSTPGTYSETVNVITPIASGADYEVVFPEWTEVPEGTYTMTAIVILAGDEEPANNEMSIDLSSVEFGNYDETIIYAYDVSDWTGSGFEDHIVGVNPADGVMSDIGASGLAGDLYCGDFIDGILVGIADNVAYGFTNTGVAYELATITGLSGASGLAWDVAGDEIYVSTTTALYTVDDDANAAEIGTYTSTSLMIGIAADIDGNLYGVDLNDNLYLIDKATGAETVIGPLGIDINYAQDIGYDRTNGILYGTFYLGGGTGGLYTVDVTTGAATQIGTDFGDELSLCAIYYEESTYTVTFNVDMNSLTTFDPATQEVYVSGGNAVEELGGIGAYERWATPGSNADFLMTDVDVDGIYTLVLSGVLAGDYEYKYFWIETGTPSWDNGYPDANATFSVVDADVVLNDLWPVGIEDLTAKGISIYPNPSNGVFNVNVESNFNLEVLDITGKIVNTQVLTGNSTIEINTPGVYFLRFSNENGSITQRVIVQ